MPTKIIFRLHQDADGYPPVAYEGIWAEPDNHGHYIIDNIPFFTHDATLGDVVQADSYDGELWFTRLIEATPSSLIRVVYYSDAVLTQIRSTLHDLGCETEWDAIHHLIAVHIPTAVSLTDVQAFLAKGFQAEEWDYEEAILRHE